MGLAEGWEDEVTVPNRHPLVGAGSYRFLTQGGPEDPTADSMNRLVLEGIFVQLPAVLRPCKGGCGGRCNIWHSIKGIVLQPLPPHRALRLRRRT